MREGNQGIYLKNKSWMITLLFSVLLLMALFFAVDCGGGGGGGGECVEGQYACKDNKVYECRVTVVNTLIWEEVENCNFMGNYTCVIDKDGHGACVPSGSDGGLPDGGATDAGVDGGGGTDAGADGGGGADAGVDGGNIPCSGQTCSVVTTKNMFVTSFQLSGYLVGAMGIDYNCNTVPAGCGGSGSNYKAMVVYEGGTTPRRACSTPNCSGGTSEHSDWVLSPCVEYKRCDGTTVIGTTDPLAGIFCFTISDLVNSFDTSAGDIWSGLKGDWTTFSGYTCNNWNSNGGNDNGTIGDKTSKTNSSIDRTSSACNGLNYVLCVQQ